MRFLLVRSENLVVVDNAELTISCAALPTNVEMVVYNEIDGKIEYNDRPSVRIAFTDPSPYQTLINSWITAAAAQTPALQLAQAKQVKNDLIDGVFHHKRRLPFTLGPWQYDARDDNVQALDLLVQSNASASSENSGLIGSINTAFSNLVNALNTNVGQHNTSAGAVNAWSNSNYLAWTKTIGSGILIAGSSLYALGYPFGDAPVPPGQGGFVLMNSLSAPTVSGTVNTSLSYTGSVTHQPLNATSPQTIDTNSVHNAITGIASRRNTLNADRMAKKAAVNALTTIPAVVAYDATTGWSS
jgi:hypothetical protein